MILFCPPLQIAWLGLLNFRVDLIFMAYFSGQVGSIFKIPSVSVY